MGCHVPWLTQRIIYACFLSLCQAVLKSLMNVLCNESKDLN